MTGTASASGASGFTFLYAPEVGSTVKVHEEQEASKKRRKQERNADNWKVKCQKARS